MKSALVWMSTITIATASQAQTKSPPHISGGTGTFIDVQPQARAIFRRAASLYGGTKTWRLRWLEWGVDGQRGPYNPQNKLIVFDRAGRIHVDDPNGIVASLVVDGKTHWELITTGHTFFHNPIVYTREPAGPFKAAHELSGGNTGENLFDDFLENHSPLASDRIEGLVRHPDFRGFSAKILSPQPFDGEPCNLVRLTNRTLSASAKRRTQTVKQSTFWFARSDGRLMRWQTQQIEGDQVVNSSDAQVQTQEFNPVLSNQDFKFVPPKGAVLYRR